jgi:hypothetical protein
MVDAALGRAEAEARRAKTCGAAAELGVFPEEL